MIDTVLTLTALPLWPSKRRSHPAALFPRHFKGNPSAEAAISLRVPCFSTQRRISAFRFLAYVNQFDLAERVILESLDAVRPKVQSLIRDEHNRMVNNGSEQKCRILIPQSRILFGVCDAWDVLAEGECHVRITHESKGLPMTLLNCDVVVTRNPCLHPGDLQKLKAVQKDELSHLVNCIVFSTRGNRPAADLMSGGDLDGDMCKFVPSSVFFYNQPDLLE